MSANNKEAQSSQTRTPEEIATELEKKAQSLETEGKMAEATRKRELAGKVRAVESDTVTGTTELKLQSLQAKLPPLERKDFDEARKMDHKKVAETVIGGAGLATAIDKFDSSMEGTGLGKLGIKDSIKDWLKEEIAEEPGEGADFFDKIIHKLKMMFLVPFAKMFGVDLSKKKEGKEGEKGEGKEEKTTGNDKKETMTQKVAYSGMVSYLVMKGDDSKTFDSWWDAVGKGARDNLWGKDKRQALDKSTSMAQTMLEGNLSGKTFLEIKSYNLDTHKLTLPEGQLYKDAGLLAMKTIVDNEKFFDTNLQHLESMKPDWRQKTIKEILTALYKGIGFEKIEAIKEGLGKINISNPKEMFVGFSAMMWRKNEDGTEGGIMKENIQELRAKGLSNDLLTRCFVNTDKEGKMPISTYRNTVEIKPYPEATTQSFVKDMIKEGGFGLSIVRMMKEMGIGDYSSQYNNGESLSMKRVLEVYILTKGSTDINSLNTGTKTTLYMLLSSFVIEDNPGEETVKKLIEFVDSPDSKYMTEMKSVFAFMLDRSTYEAVGLSIGLGKETLKALWQLQESKPAVFYGAILTIGLIAFASWRATRVIVMIGALGAVLEKITGIASAAIIGKK